MTTFFDSDDLMRHLFDCIDKGDRQHATLVCKGWKDVSYTMPTWRKANLGVLDVDGAYMKLFPAPVSRLEVSRLSLKEIFAERKHIVHFVLWSRCEDSESWADMATSMAHVQWLNLRVHLGHGEENEKSEIEPFRMDGLPSLTFLELSLYPDKHTTSLSLHLPGLLSLRHRHCHSFGRPHNLDLQCPKLETLDFFVMRGMAIAPSLFSNLRSLTARFHIIPDSMLDGNGKELVLGACPQLTTLSIYFPSNRRLITSLALDLPSLEYFLMSSCSSLETLRLTCPNLVHVEMGSCPRLSLPPTLMARLTRFRGEVETMVTRRTHEDEANYRHVIEGWPLLEILSLQGPPVVQWYWGVDVTLVCPCLRDLSISNMEDLETCKVVSPVLSKLGVEHCPLLDVSSMIQPSLENVDVHDCNLEEGTKWTLPNLRRLDLSDVKTTQITVNYAPPTSVGVDSGGQVHQLSIDWEDKRQSEGRRINTRLFGISLEVSEEKALFLDAKDCATKLRIVAPSATKLHLKRCGALEELDIDCHLLLELVGDFPPKIREMVDSFSKKCPYSKKSL